MSAAPLTNNRDTGEYAPGSVEHEFPVADNVHIYNGAMVAIDANGRLTPASASTTTFAVGRAIEEVDNTVAGHTAGGKTCKFHVGVFRWTNVGSIAATSVGNLVYPNDDNGVLLSGTSNTLCGIIKAVDSVGVWVQMGFEFVAMARALALALAAD